MINAEDVNYWKTSKSSSDVWMDRTKRQIEHLGGQVLVEGFGKESITNRAAFMLAFEIGGDKFKAVWPVFCRVRAAMRERLKFRRLPCYITTSKPSVFLPLCWERVPPFSHFCYCLMVEASVPELMQTIPELLVSVPQLIEGEEV